MTRLFIIILMFSLSACSSNSHQQNFCQAIDSSRGSSDPIEGVRRAIYGAFIKTDYDCIQKDKYVCVNSDGSVKDNCTVTK